MLIASILTLAWLTGLGFIIFFNWSEVASMAPNEWGDFLAGSFAPLAFMWLVFGYFLQGRELKLNREALLLQAQELKNSVSQQKELVGVTREEIELNRSEYNQRIKREARDARPAFTVLSSDFFEDLIVLHVINYGSSIRDVRVFTIAPKGIATVNNESGELYYQSISSDSTIKLEVSFTEMAEENISNFVLIFSYMDGRGESIFDRYMLEMDFDEVVFKLRSQEEVDDFLKQNDSFTLS